MGARFRLPATLDVSKLGLPPAGAIIARAVQQYGLVVRDSAAAVTLVAQDPVNLPANPYPALFGGLRPDQLLARFPWSKLQALRSLPNQAWPQPAPAAPGGVPIKGGVKRLRRAKASAIRSLG